MRILPVLLALGVALPVAPARAAEPFGTYYGAAHITCFGCGASTGTAELSYTGPGGTGVILANAAHAAYDVTMPTGAACQVLWAAHGWITGVVDREFNWTVIGNVLLVTEFAGSKVYTGSGTFFVTSPVGLPCGSSVDASVSWTTAAP